MEELKFKNIGKYNDLYTFNNLFYEINSDDTFDELLARASKKNDFKELESYLDLYLKYISELIDEADSFIFDTIKNEKEIYCKKLKYTEKYEMNYTDNGYVPFIMEVFDISNNNDKNVLKENICFNIGDCERETCIIPVNRKFILNKQYLDGVGTYRLIKNNQLLAELWQLDGYIYDYRPKEEIEKHKEKYRNMK